MAKILAFPEEAGRRVPDLGGPDREGAVAVRRRAEIVIFPGVRIERQDFSLADRLPRRRNGAPGGDDGRPRRGRG